MSDPREIYLQPECCADESVGRLWCEDDAPVDCEDGVPWTKYVIAEEYERLRAERDSQQRVCITVMAELAECKKDAERYRWLRDNGMFVDFVGDPDNQVRVWHSTEPPKVEYGKTLDEAVDAALKEKP